MYNLVEEVQVQNEVIKLPGRDPVGQTKVQKFLPDDLARDSEDQK